MIVARDTMGQSVPFAIRCRWWRAAFCVAVAGVLSGATPVSAIQGATDEGWNEARAVRLMAMARERRALPLADTALLNYEGRAEGLVYFYLDRRDVDERVLIRTDQVALEVYWAQPDRTKQRIIGLRDESTLPNRMYYHLDHLTVVQNGFGDVMRMGDGDEVRDVPHPAAPGSDAIYDFRLADSLALRLPGAADPIKAYRIEVRPKRTDRPAFVGAVYVDHMTGDIVRMTFTFTPVSYVDPRLDYINISLDNSLWQGRYWLPYEQAVEIRRQVPQLDFIVSSVIQARFRVQDYTFNQDLPESLFWGYRVATVPIAEREAYEFDRGIYDDLHEAGLAPPPELRDVRAMASELLRKQALSGLPRLRLSLPNASSAFRYNRAEGVYVGWGTSYRSTQTTWIEAVGGYAFGAGHPPLSLGIARQIGSADRIRVDAYHNRARDIGPGPTVAGAINTLASFRGDDYTDPFFASGVTVGWQHELGTRTRLDVGMTVEQQQPAGLAERTALLGDHAFRDVRSTAEGTAVVGRVGIRRRGVEAEGMTWTGSASVNAGVFEGGFFAAPMVEVGAARGSPDRRSKLDLRLSAGTVLGSPAPQHLFLAGGRQTIPGYAYRSFGGDVFALASVEAGRDLLFPFVRGRLVATAGWVDVLGEDPSFGAQYRVPADWGTSITRGFKPGIGVGLGFGWDIVRLDLVRGLASGGEWQFLVSIDQVFWPIL